MSTTTTRRPRRVTRVLDATSYLVTDLVAAIPVFVVVITGLALSLGLAVTFVLAVPFAWATVWSARAAGAVERWRLWAFLDIDLPAPARASNGGWFARLKADVKSRSTWQHIAHGVVQLPVACVTFTIASVAWAVPLGLVALPAYIRALPSRKMEFWVTTVRPGWVPYALAPVGLILLAASIALLPPLARFRARMSTALLRRSESDGLKQRVERLESSRSLAVDAAETERRRIERDLHDGAQQRLVALAMDLGMAREKLSSEPDQARALIEEAHDEAKRAIVELRDLARGIHPVVLTDRGLSAAVASVAARSPIPVKFEVNVPERPSAAIEGIAYFVVSEALTNVAKHANATVASVAISRVANRLAIEVTDDGIGGADAATGSGIAGLRDRVGAVDGWLHLASPVGGPTTLTVELPCAS